MTGAVTRSDEGGIATLVIDRPDKHNAFTLAMLDEMTAHLRAVATDPSVRVVVVTGAGPSAFSTGADLAEMQALDQFAVQRSNRHWIDLFATIERIPQPVIAAVHGHALAGGTELALCCDFVVAARTAQLGLTEARVGVIPGAGACIRITRWVGRATAKQLVMLGDPISADEAHRIGLVTDVVEPDELERATAALARRLAERSPLALRAAKRAINVGSELDLDRGIEYALAEFALLFSGSDQREGMAAFLEKRRADFADGPW